MKMCGPSFARLVIFGAILTAYTGLKYVAAFPHSPYWNPWGLPGFWKRSELEVVTFNTGLHVSEVPKYENRRDAFLDTVTNGNIPGDVVCLQEVWEADDLRAIVNAAVSQFPYSYSTLHISDGVLSNASSTPACDISLVSNVVQCLLTNCSTLSGLQNVMCALTTCREVFDSLSQDCFSCLNRIFASSQVASLTLPAFQARIQTCLATPYPTTFGLLLLSKKPLVDPEVVNYHGRNSLIVPRGYIKAKVEGYHVFCTHLVSELSKDIYLEVGPFTSFKEQSLFEIQSLLKVARTDYVKSILIGDFNANPAIPANNITGALTDTYNFVSRLYVSPYLKRIGECTFCGENPLSSSSLNKLYDHIFVPKYSWWTWLRVGDVRRVLDSNIANQNFTLSDHYGVSAVIRKWSWV
ncbi:uncharacterized protein LOC106151238 [Lingula anatina]|uniref:Uncharacterized protein LOC106151238 n=1 Tax=Lingula anatina TaxID=7574 RepID=A0A1S3H1E7_LINAN|nr:uncharacterized protein LOC106151238 [Lingula anatina]|eukprot:XP_013379833.1 uncharacterized protein LOC106151238 [Lingula anatina]